MLKAGLIGVGSMGRGHLDNYVRMLNEKSDIKLVALCDINPEKFKNSKGTLNIEGVGDSNYDFSQFNLYTDMDEMLEKEELDLVSIALPTFLHCEATVKCLNKGINVFCEKPMALNLEQCQLMIDTAKKNNKKLMIGQVLRFWGEYEYLRNIVKSGEFGEPVSGYFFRGGSTPDASWNQWIIKKECGGGAVYDQHVHDVDIIQHIFGMPKAVSSIGKNVIPGSNFDAVSTNYIYDNGMVINSQNDWTLAGTPFMHTFRMNFTGGTIIMDQDGLKVAKTGETFRVVDDFCKENGYYKEILYLADCIINNKENTVNAPESCMDSIRLVHKEIESANNSGKIVEL